MRLATGRKWRELGHGLLWLTAGTGFGFFLAERGTRWFPTTVDLLLLWIEIALLCIITTRIADGTIKPEQPGRLKLRKRAITALVVLIVATLGHLASFGLQRPCALTRLGPDQFALAFDQDLSKLAEYDTELGHWFAYLEQQHPLFDAGAAPALTADDEDLLRQAWQSIYSTAFALDGIRAFYEDWYRFDPSRSQRDRHVRSFLLSFGAEASLYDHSTRLITLMGHNPDAVKFIDALEDEMIPKNSFSHFREQLQGSQDRARIIAGTQYLHWLQDGLCVRDEAQGWNCGRLWNELEIRLGTIEQQGDLKLATLSLGSDLQVFKRTFHRLWYPAQREVACWMGNTRVRRIGQYFITPEQRRAMDQQLQPGDILLSRKNWHLSNAGLPGFWPHGILYLGTPDKLTAYFDDPSVQTYLEQLTGESLTLEQYLARTYPLRWQRYRAGTVNEPFRVMESIKQGVLLNTFTQASGDYLVGLRPRLDKVAQAQAIIEAFSHLDKPYDFYFDFATDHALVCTELLWRSYRPAQGKEGLNIDLVEIAGRHTLPANEIARLFVTEYNQPERQLDFVLFYDAAEEKGSSFESTEQAFIKSVDRLKWSFLQQ